MFKLATLSGNEKMQKVKMAMLTMLRAHWEHGTAAQAFRDAGDDEVAILMAHEALHKQLVDGRFAMSYRQNSYTDPCVNGDVVMFAYKKTGEEKYKIAAEKMLQYIDHAPASPEGIQLHSDGMPFIHADCTYMVAPFYAVMGRFKDAVHQVDLRFNFLWNEVKQVLDHNFNVEKNCWNNQNPWGGGNGWNAAAIVQVLKALPSEMKDEIERLKGYLDKLVAGVLKYQLDNGLFYDFLDNPNSFVETNAAQMMAYSIYRGVQWGFLDAKYIPAADRMREAANAKVDDMGFVQDVAGSPTFDHPGISAEGQAFYIMMEAAVEAYEKLRKS